MIRIFTLIVISVLILGCEEAAIADKEPITDKGPTAEQGSTTDNCVEWPKTMININFARHSEIRVFPGRAQGRTRHYLRFVISGKSKTKVTIRGKTGDEYPGSEWITDAWEKGVDKSGSDDDESGDRFVDVCVPDLDIPKDPPGEKTYGYDIAVDGVGTLDPMVVIRD